MSKLDFYEIDLKYLEYLKTYADSSVSDYKYKNTKFYVGIILEINGLKYFAPVSSFPIKQKTNLLIKVRDKYSEELVVVGSVRLCFMIPVNDTVVKRFIINNYWNTKSISLIRKELSWCRENAEAIKKLAKRVYKWGCNEKDYNYKNCCDFRKLEIAYNNYCKQREVAAISNQVNIKK
ncbi:type III toxin-antitoxin system ToxN/AbiQ family toxin [Clostridium perfringens]|uniref:type III toxin-antitoxin system ToxN/AbiQ family toxin n=1 Tax=Clostridium perfringens TaxID=1502 RepID=UPI002247C38F|nr:type III toxin-antitoxin system ToxN/AbiQ family toxin [Clostridium perfringens]MCX0413787.1 type III toxin-antitoxin system ToxN/AbiQ family toxin [Clostridium perfringens]MDT7980833.1 type III toxin-antitoxin system ToxN/AbiQ family toxin [Clostridium perfringens]